ncbi:MAG: hypothetical protein KME45_33485 [Stenomitos rutilans HA7619-LM2]|nr:hypothetical protein [Stenomitos rutilans HA7619-LM2]
MIISQREQFAATHPPMSHKDFLETVQAPDQLAAWVVVVREAVARFLQLPPSVIYPMDGWRTLKPFFPLDGWDDIGFVISLEECGVAFLDDEAPQSLPRFVEGRFFWLHWQGAVNIGVWSVRVATHLVNSNCRLRLVPSDNDVANA